MAIALVGLLWGCGGDEAPEPEPTPASPAESSGAPESPVPADVIMPPLPSDRPRTVTDELAIKIEMPDFYPADAPVYPNTPPSKAFVTGNRINLMFGTSDSVAQVLDFLTDELPRLGWNNASVQRMSNSVSVEATKSGRRLAVMLTEFQDGSKDSTLIAVTVTAD
ncbi:MAG: hypothetical protein NZ990_17895 [Myxococcota bacterium]|nr:hypothetical protein [Myxococcota bacterium]